jgi:hypothetical protein
MNAKRCPAVCQERPEVKVDYKVEAFLLLKIPKEATSRQTDFPAQHLVLII